MRGFRSGRKRRYGHDIVIVLGYVLIKAALRSRSGLKRGDIIKNIYDEGKKAVRRELFTTISVDQGVMEYASALT
jgi:hypothetical protein